MSRQNGASVPKLVAVEVRRVSDSKCILWRRVDPATRDTDRFMDIQVDNDSARRLVVVHDIKVEGSRRLVSDVYYFPMDAVTVHLDFGEGYEVFAVPHHNPEVSEEAH